MNIQKLLFAISAGIMVATVLLVVTACSTSSLYVPPGQAVQLRSKILKAKVWVKVKSGRNEPAVMTLQEGWYCLPDDPEGS